MNRRGQGVGGGVADQSARTETRRCREDRCQGHLGGVVPRIRRQLELLSISRPSERLEPSFQPFSPRPEGPNTRGAGPRLECGDKEVGLPAPPAPVTRDPSERPPTSPLKRESEEAFKARRVVLAAARSRFRSLLFIPIGGFVFFFFFFFPGTHFVSFFPVKDTTYRLQHVC